jgi:hypothetical protein
MTTKRRQSRGKDHRKNFKSRIKQKRFERDTKSSKTSSTIRPRNNRNTILNHRNEETDNPEEAVKWQQVTDPSLIKNKLLVQNIRNFVLAQGTFFTSDEVQNQFDYEGVTKAVELLLKGEVNISDSAIKTMGERTLLQHLANKNKLPYMDCEISKHTFVSTIKNGQKRRQHHQVDA